MDDQLQMDVDDRVRDLCRSGLEKFRAGDVEGALIEWNRARMLDSEAFLPKSYIERAAHGLDPESGDVPSGLRFPLDADGESEPEISIEVDDPGDDYLELELTAGEPELQPDPEHTPGTLDLAARKFVGAAYNVFELDELDAGWSLGDEGPALPPPPERSSLESGRDEVHAGIMGVPEDAIAAPPEEEPNLDDLPIPEAVRLGGETLDMAPDSDEYREIATRELGRPAQLDLAPAPVASAEPAGLELGPAGDEMHGDSEITVPGGVDGELDGQLSLSDEALDALSPDEDATGQYSTEDTTVERPGVVTRGLALPDLDDLFADPARQDDRHEPSPEVSVTFRRDGDQTDDSLEQELTTERQSSFTRSQELTAEIGARALSESGGLDDELTTERPSIRDTGLPGVSDLGALNAVGGFGALEDDLTVERPSGGSPAVIVEPGLLDEPGIIHDQAGPGAPEPLGMSESGSWDDLCDRIREQVSGALPASQSNDDRVRNWVSAFIDRARLELDRGKASLAVTALQLALSEQPESIVAQKLIHRHRELLLEIYQAYLGDGSKVPCLAVPMHELQAENLDSRAVFLLSRIDGTFTLEEILDISGMTALEAYRHLSKLVLKGILELR